MNKEIAEWVDALRSGKYKQGCGKLRSITDEYCCLGVAEDLFGKGFVPSNLSDRYAKKSGVNTEILDPETARKMGLPSCKPRVKVPQHLRTEWFHEDTQLLTALNDSGFTFEEIAEIIEFNYE